MLEVRSHPTAPLGQGHRRVATGTCEHQRGAQLYSHVLSHTSTHSCTAWSPQGNPPSTAAAPFPLHSVGLEPCAHSLHLRRTWGPFGDVEQHWRADVNTHHLQLRHRAAQGPFLAVHKGICRAESRRDQDRSLALCHAPTLLPSPVAAQPPAPACMLPALHTQSCKRAASCTAQS